MVSLTISLDSFTASLSSFIEFSYSDRIADSSASSADDIPSVSPTLTGVEDILLAGLGDGEDDEPRSGLLDVDPLYDGLVELYKTDVSGEFTPESVEVYSYSTSLSSSRESPSCASSSASGSDSESVYSGGIGGVGHVDLALFP